MKLAETWRSLPKRQQQLIVAAVIGLGVILFVVRSRRRASVPQLDDQVPAPDPLTAVIPTQNRGSGGTGGGGTGGGTVDLGGAPSGTGGSTGTVGTVGTVGAMVPTTRQPAVVAPAPLPGTRPGQQVIGQITPGTAVVDSPYPVNDPYGGGGYFGTGNLGFGQTEIDRGGNVIVQIGGTPVTDERPGGIPLAAVTAANQAATGSAPVVNAALPNLASYQGQTATAQSIAILRAATPEQLASADWRTTFNSIVAAEGGTLRI